MRSNLLVQASSIAILATAMVSAAAFAQDAIAPVAADQRPLCPPEASGDRTDCRPADTTTSAPTNAPSSNPTPPDVDRTQSGNPDQVANVVAADGTGNSGDEILVTGSRIKLRGISGLEPGITVGAQYLQDRGLTNVADALNEIPGIRGSVTPNGSQGSFGQGVNFVNSFGLGSNRTLTLVNGRRYVSSNVNTIFNQGSAGTQVDVNVIPALLVDRIERIDTTGATTYGSDAIASTVNYILNTRLNGIIASGTSGITEEGDNYRYNVALAGGFNFAGGRGNLTLA